MCGGREFKKTAEMHIDAQKVGRRHLQDYPMAFWIIFATIIIIIIIIIIVIILGTYVGPISGELKALTNTQ